MSRSSWFGAWLRCAFAVAVITGVVTIASLREATLPLKPSSAAGMGADRWESAVEAAPALDDEGPMPDFELVSGARSIKAASDKERFMPPGTVWFNSSPLSSASLRGKVVLVDFWTYSCINSLRNLPYIEAWAAKYKSAGLVVIGVHTPEFSFEREPHNVASALLAYGVTSPVATDSSYAIWRAFDNEYWPADYFIDGRGRIRHHHYGEGDYAESERVIQELLKENGAGGMDSNPVDIEGRGVEAPASDDQQSPETYVGYRQAEHFASPEALARDPRTTYSVPTRLALNQWAFGGAWDVGAESAMLQAAPGRIAFRFHSRDLHMVLAPAMDARPVRYTVTLDGAAPGSDCGIDCGPSGSGEVREPRLYQLIRQKGRIKDRTFEIQFLDPGVQAYVFTFG
jgi:thiol-disulfide isomerase/thioredoxin